MDNERRKDIAERCLNFGVMVVQLAATLPKTDVGRILVRQFVRSGTSVGANYMEANGASSKKDFVNKIFICKKESQETKHWLRMLAKSLPELNEKIRILWKECQELTLIFQRITSTIRNGRSRIENSMKIKN